MPAAISVEEAEEVVDLILDHGYEIELKPDYSGRGMYGDTCTGYIIDRDTPISIIGWAYGKLGYEADDVPQRTDNMGLGTIVY